MHKTIILFNLFVFFFITNGYAQDTWQLKKDDNGIKVYTRANAESSFDEFKAILTISDGSLKDALKVILDIKNYESWFPDCANPKVLKQINEYHDIHYIETLTPWPAQNRYGVYEQITTLSNNDTRADIVAEAKADYPMETEGMVRITEALGKWTLEEKNNELTVTYQFKGSPGGSVPAWLANAFVVDHPFETLTNFKEQIDQ